MGFKSWETPPDFYRELDNEFQFSLDAAASHCNHLSPIYCTEKGTYFEEDYNPPLSEKDGLNFSWAGYRVFCNPPYDSSLPKWIKKAEKREAEVAVLLLPPSIDVTWYHHLMGNCTKVMVMRNKGLWLTSETLDKDFEYRLLAGRLKFWHPALREGKSLMDHKDEGDSIFDFSLPHTPGPAPRAGNLLAIFR